MRIRLRRQFSRFGATGLLIAALSASALAQDQQGVSDSRDEIIQNLLTRLRALEQEINNLKGVPPTAEHPQSPEPPESPEPPGSAEPQDQIPTPSPDLAAARFRFHAYADVGYSRNGSGDSINHFGIGELVFFGTARLTPRLSALLETEVDTDAGQNGTVPVTLERLLLQYRYNDYFTIELGQYHTAIGYYSTRFLRGSWFQTAITRPRLFQYENEGGILPLHNVGASFSGRVPSGSLGLRYVVEIGNSLNWGSNESLGNIVLNHNAINLGLSVQPRAIHGLEAGFSRYHDRFAPATGVDLNRSIWTAYVAYKANHVEFLNEGVVVETHDRHSRAGATIPGFYSQLAYRVGSNWGPYVRVEKMSVHPYGFPAEILSFIRWRSMYTAGARYDWNERTAFKLEVSREADAKRALYTSMAAQVAFSF